MDDDQGKLLQKMWLECSIDLARWARAFQDENDSMTAERLRQLQQYMLDCVQQGPEPF